MIQPNSSNEPDPLKIESPAAEAKKLPYKGEMPFYEHLEELRRRVVRCLIAVGVCFLPCYYFSKELFHTLLSPLLKVMPPGGTLIYTSLPEGFLTYLKTALVAAILMAIPYIFYQIWAFVAPGLHAAEKKLLVFIAIISTLCFLGGALFGYFVVFPLGFEFFMSFDDEMIKPLPSLNNYLSLSLQLIFAFGIVFELPMFLFILCKFGLISSKKLKRYRGYSYIAAFILGALLTPPDVLSQICMAVPLILLFEVSIWLVRFTGKNESPEKK